MSPVLDLKTCPNCESEAEYNPGNQYKLHKIECTSCPLNLDGEIHDYRELVDIWNNLPRRENNDEN